MICRPSLINKGIRTEPGDILQFYWFAYMSPKKKNWDDEDIVERKGKAKKREKKSLIFSLEPLLREDKMFVHRVVIRPDNVRCALCVRR